MILFNNNFIYPECHNYKYNTVPYNLFIHIANNLSVTEKTLLISVMISLSRSFFTADCTELAEVRLWRLMKSADVICSASPSLAMA